MSDGKIKLTIRQNTGSQFEVDVDPSASIKDLKELVAGPANMASDEMRLIFKGKILKDELTLPEYKIEDGVTVHLVKGKSAASASQNPPAAQQNSAPNANPSQTQPFPSMGTGIGGSHPMVGLGGFGMGGMQGLTGMEGMGNMQNMDPQQLGQMMNDPMVQQMLSNPQFIQQVIQSNPMLQQMVSQNPQLAMMLQNPDMLRMMMSPEVIQQSMQAMQGGGLGGMGAGGQPFQMPGATAQSQQNPNQQQQPGAANPQPNPFMGNPFMNPMMFQGAGAGAGAGAGGAGGFGMGGGLGMPAQQQQQQQDTRPARERFAKELEQIKEMGFYDEELILQLLQQTNGNVSLTMELLFSKLGAN